MNSFPGDAAVFLDVNAFGEMITYTPQTGAPKSIAAIVERGPLAVVSHGGNQFVQGKDKIYIANDATLGVTSIKERFDKVTYKPTVGGADKTAVIAKIIEQDAGMWHLEIGA